ARQWYVLAGEADVTAAHAPVADQTTGDELGRVNRSRKTDALRRADDGCVDADDESLRRDERAARIARIQSRVGLNHVVHQTPRLRPQTAPQRAHDARRHGALETVRVADGDDELTDAHALRAAELRRHKVRRSDAYHGQVCVGIVADQLRLIAPPVREAHFKSGRAMHHVTVRQDETVGRKDETRTVAVRLALAAPPAHLMRDLNVYDRTADALSNAADRARVSIKQLVVRCVGRKLSLRAVQLVDASACDQFKFCVRLNVHLSLPLLQNSHASTLRRTSALAHWRARAYARDDVGDGRARERLFDRCVRLAQDAAHDCAGVCDV